MPAELITTLVVAGAGALGIGSKLLLDSWIGERRLFVETLRELLGQCHAQMEGHRGALDAMRRAMEDNTATERQSALERYNARIAERAVIDRMATTMSDLSAELLLRRRS